MGNWSIPRFCLCIHLDRRLQRFQGSSHLRYKPSLSLGARSKKLLLQAGETRKADTEAPLHRWDSSRSRFDPPFLMRKISCLVIVGPGYCPKGAASRFLWPTRALDISRIDISHDCAGWDSSIDYT